MTNHGDEWGSVFTNIVPSRWTQSLIKIHRRYVNVVGIIVPCPSHPHRGYIRRSDLRGGDWVMIASDDGMCWIRANFVTKINTHKGASPEA